jgi:hypothetical protein
MVFDRVRKVTTKVNQVHFLCGPSKHHFVCVCVCVWSVRAPSYLFASVSGSGIGSAMFFIYSFVPSEFTYAKSVLSTVIIEATRRTWLQPSIQFRGKYRPVTGFRHTHQEAQLWWMRQRKYL